MTLNGLLSSSAATGDVGRGTSCRLSVGRGSSLGLLCCVSCSTAVWCAPQKVVWPAVLLSSCVGDACGKVEAAGKDMQSVTVVGWNDKRVDNESDAKGVGWFLVN